MPFTRTASFVLAIVFPLVVPAGRALGECSPSGLDEVRMELRAAVAPDCGPKSLKRAFARACEKAAVMTERAVVQCAGAKTPRIVRAHRILMGLRARLDKPGMARRLTRPCDALYRTELERLDADLAAAASGTETTTTTSPPGTPTTTTLPPCTTVNLEVDKSDCTRVTSDPPHLVVCGPNCDVETFAVPASGSLRLKGTPAPGDSGASFSGDCDDDGTVPLQSATPPDCSLSCDCSSDP
jgi:hypothetical protein